MTADQEEMVAFRLAGSDRKAIQRLIDAGEFRNRSDFFRFAVKNALAGYDGKTRTKMDLEMEGVELPQGGPRGAKPSRRAGKGMHL